MDVDLCYNKDRKVLNKKPKSLDIYLVLLAKLFRPEEPTPPSIWLC